MECVIHCVNRLLMRERLQSDSSEDVFLSDQQPNTSKRGSHGNAFWINPSNPSSSSSLCIPLSSSHHLPDFHSSLSSPSSSLTPACVSSSHRSTCTSRPVHIFSVLKRNCSFKSFHFYIPFYLLLDIQYYMQCEQLVVFLVCPYNKIMKSLFYYMDKLELSSVLNHDVSLMA